MFVNHGAGNGEKQNEEKYDTFWEHSGQREQHRFVKCMQSGPRDVSFTSEGTAKGQFLSCNYLKLTSNL